jgi:hypothetical protein
MTPACRPFARPRRHAGSARVGLAKVGRARFSRAIIITHTLGNHGCPRSDLQDCAPRPRRGSLRQDRPPHRHRREGCRPRRCRPRPAEGASRCENSRYRIRPKQRPAIGVPSDALGELPRVARPRRARPPRRCARVVTTHRSRSRAEGRGRPRVARAETARMRAVYFFLRDERLAGGLPTGRATRAGAVDRRTVSIVGRYRIYHLPVRSRRSSGSSGASSRRDCAPSGVPASPSPSGRALQRSTTGWNANDSCFACLIF